VLVVASYFCLIVGYWMLVFFS